jgi:hypothetical protein
MQTHALVLLQRGCGWNTGRGAKPRRAAAAAANQLTRPSGLLTNTTAAGFVTTLRAQSRQLLFGGAVKYCNS